MFQRTILFGTVGVIAGAIGVPAFLSVLGERPFEVIPWPYWIWIGAAGFVGMAVGNLLNEYFGLYKVNLLGRLYGRLAR